MRAPVNRIIPFSSVDGPGNRTAVFLQCCNLNCRYCHNPETRRLCIACGKCVSHCPGNALALIDGEGNAAGQANNGRYVEFQPERCLKCDTCIRICPNDASPRLEWLTPLQTWERVERQRPFIRGLTVSGGECMLWTEFLTELGEICCREGLEMLLDSNGTVSFRGHPRLLEVCSGVMLDIKAMRSEDHERLTEGPNTIVLDNAVFLANIGKLAEVRAVIAPEWYDVRGNAAALGEFLRPLYEIAPFRIKIISFRPQGVRPAYAQGAVPSAELMQEMRTLIASKLGISPRDEHIIVV